jgi:hypothetical protein
MITVNTQCTTYFVIFHGVVGDKRSCAHCTALQQPLHDNIAVLGQHSRIVRVCMWSSTDQKLDHADTGNINSVCFQNKSFMIHAVTLVLALMLVNLLRIYFTVHYIYCRW